jgi:hypothetical protein
MGMPSSFYKFAANMLQDIGPMGKSGEGAFIGFALSMLSYNEQLELKRFLTDLLNSNATDTDLVALWRQANSEWKLHRGGKVRAVLAETKAQIDEGLLLKVLTVLVDDWNPLQLDDPKVAQEKYDALVGPIAGAVNETESTMQLAGLIESYETHSFHLAPNCERAKLVAAKLRALRS